MSNAKLPNSPRYNIKHLPLGAELEWYESVTPGTWMVRLHDVDDVFSDTRSVGFQFSRSFFAKSAKDAHRKAIDLAAQHLAAYAQREEDAEIRRAAAAQNRINDLWDMSEAVRVSEIETVNPPKK